LWGFFEIFVLRILKYETKIKLIYYLFSLGLHFKGIFLEECKVKNLNHTPQTKEGIRIQRKAKEYKVQTKEGTRIQRKAKEEKGRQKKTKYRQRKA